MKIYKFYCEQCSWSLVSEAKNIDLVEVTRNAVQGHFKKDEFGRKSIEQTKMHKCPQCGRLVTPKEMVKDASRIDGDKSGTERPEIS